MTEQRTVRKSLIAQQDFDWGEGQSTQTRAGNLYTVDQMRIIQPVNSLAELNTLDTDKFKKAALFVDQTVVLYHYNGTAWISEGQLLSTSFSATAFPVGTVLTTGGYHSVGDGGHGKYHVVAAADYVGTPDEQGAAFTDAAGNIVVLMISYKPTLRQFGAVGDGVTDDSAAVQAAANLQASVACGKGKFLCSNVTVEDCAFYGIGVGANDAPYDSDGTVFIVTDQVNPAFNIKRGAAFYGCNFYYPEQDGTVATPITYPALFEFDTTSTVTNFTLDHCVLVNPFNALNVQGDLVGPGVAHGRINISNTQAYAVNNFITADDVLDDIHLDNFVISVGVYQDVALVGDQYLRKWTQANGVAILLNNEVDGFSATNGIIFGYRQAVVSTGDIDLINFDQISIDSCPVVWNKTGGEVRNMVWSNFDIFAYDPFDPSFNVAAFNLVGTSSKIEATFTAGHVAQAQGTVFLLTDDGASILRIGAGCIIRNWGQATGATGNLAAVTISNPNAIVRLDNVEANTGYAPSSTVNGINFDQISVRSCDMLADDQAVILANGNIATIVGNSTAFTTTASVTVGTVTRLLNDANNFDIP